MISRFTRALYYLALFAAVCGAVYVSVNAHLWRLR
jgi:hypothetical protein